MGEARSRLEGHDHGILCTVHAARGVDAVPVVYALDDDGYVGVPVDLVKPKVSLRLQRERNLEGDPAPRSWSSTGIGTTGRVCGGCGRSCGGRTRSVPVGLPAWLLGSSIATRSTTSAPFARVIVLRIEDVVGWAAYGSTTERRTVTARRRSTRCAHGVGPSGSAHRSASERRRILPVVLRGSSSRNSTRRGTLCRAS